jgi:hypothetical protein
MLVGYRFNIRDDDVEARFELAIILAELFDNPDGLLRHDPNTLEYGNGRDKGDNQRKYSREIHYA